MTSPYRAMNGWLRRRQDFWAVTAMMIAALVSRLLLRSHYLYNWDSVNFSLGLERFSPGEHQPHPPGYILYVALGRLFHIFWGDANTALVAMSIIGALVSIPLIYVLGRDIFGRRCGLIAAFLLLFSPLGWFYGEVALSYEVEFPLVLLATWLLFRMFFHRSNAIAAAVVIGLAGGFRQDALLFLGPLWFLAGLWVSRTRMLISWGALVASVLVWLVPLIHYSGGIDAFRAIGSAQYNTGVFPTSYFALGLDGIQRNAMDVFHAALWLLGTAGVMLIYIAGLFLMPHRLVREGRLLFIIVLMLPPLAFFLLFHFGQPGYLLVFGAPLLILTARALAVLSQDLANAWAELGRSDPTGKGKALPAVNGGNVFEAPGANLFLAGALLLVALTNTGLFIKVARLDWPIPGGGTVISAFGPFSAIGVRETDRQMAAAVKAVRQFEPENTLVVSIYPFEPYAADWRRLMYYLPEYRVVMLRMDSGHGYHDAIHHTHVVKSGSEIPISETLTRIVFVGTVPQLEPATASPVPIGDKTALVPISTVTMPESGNFKVGNYKFMR